MRMTDIILQKRAGQALTDEQIAYVVGGYVEGGIPDYQVSALLMAICFRGMDARETAALTGCMAASGEQADLSSIPGVKVDKHSTGGVGDKTSLVIGPIVAACGVPVAKMSGRGLGHTGGTLDKLESIPGLTTEIVPARFHAIVRETGLAIIGQSGNIAPADKKLYALRDVTGTVDNLSLIASSIMSKKLASGADAILLDVKTGSGAFMKTLDDSIELARAMVSIGERMGRKTLALVTDMDLPLGRAVGNALEVCEAVETLRGGGPADFCEICLQLGANMLFLAGKGALQTCRALAEEALLSGRAFEKLRAMVRAQGGDDGALVDLSRLPRAPLEHTVSAPRAGWITHMDTERVGHASVVLGAGRARKEDGVDYGAGLILRAKTGEYVQAGAPLAQLYTAREEAVGPAAELLLGALTLSERRPPEEALIRARVSADGVERY